MSFSSIFVFLPDLFFSFYLFPKVCFSMGAVSMYFSHSGLDKKEKGEDQVRSGRSN